MSEPWFEVFLPCVKSDRTGRESYVSVKKYVQAPDARKACLFAERLLKRGYDLDDEAHALEVAVNLNDFFLTPQMIEAANRAGRPFINRYEGGDGSFILFATEDRAGNDFAKTIKRRKDCVTWAKPNPEFDNWFIWQIELRRDKEAGEQHG